MNRRASRLRVSKIKSYVIWDDFGLVCRKTLHTNTLDTPSFHEHKDFYELVTVASGSGVHQVEGYEHQISPGSVFLIQPHQSHCYIKYDNLLIYNLIFSGRFIRYILPDLNRLPGYQLLFNLSSYEAKRNPSDGIRIQTEFFPEVLHVLDKMDQLNSSARSGDKTLLISLFAYVMLLFARHVHWAGPTRQLVCMTHLSKLLSELEKNFTASWSLEKMAKLCNMSVSGFRQSFRQFTGLPPLEYLVQLRLDKAAVLLANSTEALEIIAAACGFNDVNYFSKQFKKHFNILPSRYRKDCQSGRRSPDLGSSNQSRAKRQTENFY